MSAKDFMTGGGGDFGGGGASSSFGPPVVNTGGASGSWSPTTQSQDPNQSQAETNRLNSYQHNTSNNVVSSQDEYKLDLLPNILDNYDTYTYHWKLFITSIEDAASGNILNLANQSIIAESGVSDLTIDKIEITGIAVPSVQAGTGTQTHLKFEIVEPSGAGLLDKLYYQSVSLGIGNWFVMPCFLQLEFRGRDPDTAQSLINGAPAGIGALKWVWPIQLTNTKANVTNVGTRYEFNAILYDEMAQSNNYFSIQHNVVLRNLGKFSDAMKDLEDKLNADQYEKLVDNYSIPDSYRIVVDPVLQKALITLPDSNKSSSRTADFSILDKKTASFSTGTGVDKIVDSLLGNTDYYQKLMQNSDTRSSEPKPSTAETDQMKKLWRIVTATKPIAYDSLRQNYAVAITIYIIEYDIGVTDVTPAQTGQTPDAIPASKKRMMEYINKKIMNKKYDYIFTGLNDQIKNFDLNMNFSFVAALSRFGGIFYDSAMRDKGISQKAMEIYENTTKQLRETLQWINDPPKGADVEARIAQTQKSIDDAKLDPAIRARYTTLLNNAKPAQRTAYVQQAQASGGILADGSQGSLNSAKNAAKGLALPVSATNANGDNIQLTFISDINLNSQTTKDAEDTAKNLARGKLRPVPYVETNQEKNLAFGTEATSDPARSRVSSIFSTALYSTVDASLLQIKLTIKGDPYWLFPRSIGANEDRLIPLGDRPNSEAIDIIKNTAKSTDSVNVFGTDNFVIIRFRTPRIYNETTGVIDPYTEVDTFSGVYRVTEIISKFEMGVFSQELSCYLDPVINLSDFLRDIEEASKKQQPTISVTPAYTLPNTITVPDTAIKTQKILGSLAPGQSLSIPGLPKNSIGPIIEQASNIPSTLGLTPAQLTAQTLGGKTIG